MIIRLNKLLAENTIIHQDQPYYQWSDVFADQGRGLADLTNFRQSSFPCIQQNQCLLLGWRLLRFLFLSSCIKLHYFSLVLKALVQIMLLSAKSKHLIEMQQFCSLFSFFEFWTGLLVDWK